MPAAAIAASLVTALLGCVPAPRAEPRADTAVVAPPAVSFRGRTKFGVHSDVAWYKDSAQRAAILRNVVALHAQVARVSLLWTYIEWTKGRRDWSVPDDVVRRLGAAGVDVIFVVYTSPPWANGADPDADPLHYLRVPAREPAFATWLSEYRAFVRDAALRYEGRVTMWELGNEENTDYYWRPAVNVAQYGRWYTAIDGVLHAVDPANQTAVGGLTALNAWYGAGGASGRAFLQALYTAGVRPANVAVHPYASRGQAPDVTLPNAENFDDLAAIRQVMVRNGASSGRVWVTEWGWDTRKGVSEADQATYVRASLDRLATRYPYVTVATYFSQFDTPNARFHYGLYRADQTPKPAAHAFAAFLRRTP